MKYTNLIVIINIIYDQFNRVDILSNWLLIKKGNQ